jgi:capsid protein
VQDVQAQRIGIRAGLVSRSAAILAQGEDPESVDAEHAADNERADRLGLVFDSDPRMRDSAGNVTDNQEHTNDES